MGLIGTRSLDDGDCRGSTNLVELRRGREFAKASSAFDALQKIRAAGSERRKVHGGRAQKRLRG
jgi:hypothetical protein